MLILSATSSPIWVFFYFTFSFLYIAHRNDLMAVPNNSCNHNTYYSHFPFSTCVDACHFYYIKHPYNILQKVDNEGVWEYANKNGKSYKALCKFVKSRYICREGNTGGLEEGRQEALVSPTTMRVQRFRNSMPRRWKIERMQATSWRWFSHAFHMHIAISQSILWIRFSSSKPRDNRLSRL